MNFRPGSRPSNLENTFGAAKKFGKLLFAGLILFFIGPIVLMNLFEKTNAEDILIVQYPMGGISYNINPGIKWQGGGRATYFKKRDSYDFQIPIRFNDNGHGTLVGSIQYEVPLDKLNLYNLYTKFGSQEAIQKQLIETVVNKATYLTGSLMSSKQSSAEMRNDLIKYIEDQIENGVYQTTQKDIRVKDPLNEQIEKTVTIVEITRDKNGQISRQEKGVLSQFGLKPFNFSIKQLNYDETVEGQIKKQQDLAMQVQTSIAQAKQAEQRKQTVEMEGQANAAKAKWDQEVVKAQAVTQAEQQREVAKLERDAAEFTKQKLILEGQGESEKKKLVMFADGALTQKLQAYLAVNEKYADAISKYQGAWVPSVVMGGGQSGSANGAQALIDLLQAKTAKDLALDLSVPKK